METKDALEDVKKLIRDKRFIIGTQNTMKKLKSNKLERIWLSSNVPTDIKDDITKYSEMNNVAVAQLDIPNDELGVICKKQFSVSIVSLAKGEK
jgi:ribosomal protein L30E